MTHVLREVFHSTPSVPHNENFFWIFQSISRDLKIFAISSIIRRNRRSLKLLIQQVFRAELVHNLVGHNVPIVADNIFYTHLGTRPIIFNLCILDYCASPILKALKNRNYIAIS